MIRKIREIFKDGAVFIITAVALVLTLLIIVSTIIVFVDLKYRTVYKMPMSGFKENTITTQSELYVPLDYEITDIDKSEISPVLNHMPKILTDNIKRIVVSHIWLAGDNANAYVSTNNVFERNTIFVREPEFRENDYLIIHEAAHLLANKNQHDSTEAWIHIFEKEWTCDATIEYGCLNKHEAYAESVSSVLLKDYQHILENRPLSKLYILDSLGIN